MTTKEKKLKTSGKKEAKRKPKYGMFSCVNYIYQILWRTKRSQVFLGIAIVPVTLAVSALSLYTPSIILAKLEGAEGFSTIALVILGLLLARLLFDLGNDSMCSIQRIFLQFFLFAIKHKNMDKFPVF